MKKIKGYESVLKMTQPELKAALVMELQKFYKEVISADGFLYAKGSRILLTAHMDTVHKEPVREIVRKYKKGKTYLSSPQGLGGDDRNGVWAIVKILRTTKFRPSILFCEDEEIGSVGAKKFAKSKQADDLKELLYIVELDRRNSEDAVFYDCGNEKFQDYICDITGNKIAKGSFSDICELSPVGDVASVNLSCGYYEEHKYYTYTVVEEMNEMIEKVKRLLADEENVKEKFEYEDVYENGYSYYFGRGMSSYYDDYVYGGDYYKEYNEQTYIIINSNYEKYEIDAVSEAEAIGYYLMENYNAKYSDIEWTGTSDEFARLFEKEVSYA